jgi:hypothetical protein
MRESVDKKLESLAFDNLKQFIWELDQEPEEFRNKTFD